MYFDQDSSKLRNYAAKIRQAFIDRGYLPYGISKIDLAKIDGGKLISFNQIKKGVFSVGFLKRNSINISKLA